MERIDFRNVSNTENTWAFILRNAGESTTAVIIGVQARIKTDSQTHNNATFDRLPLSNAVCKIGSEKYPVDGIECNYDRDNYVKFIMKLNTSIDCF